MKKIAEEVMNEHQVFLIKFWFLMAQWPHRRNHQALSPGKIFSQRQEIIVAEPNLRMERVVPVLKAQKCMGMMAGSPCMVMKSFDNLSRWRTTEKHRKINWYAMNFFAYFWSWPRFGGDKVAATTGHLVLSGLEIRSFKNKKGIYYDLGKRHKTLPHGINWHMFSKYPVYKRIRFAPFSKLWTKINKQADRIFYYLQWYGWRKAVFKDVLANYKIARQFDDHFMSLKLINRGQSEPWLRRIVICRVSWPYNSVSLFRILD